uniref:Plasmid recombination enzyme n=1 Tax=Oenococcus oeni TaxID=1247 RepID=Q9ZF11_OENOE|nr:hypothetical protein [Oenococcus oeni]
MLTTFTFHASNFSNPLETIRKSHSYFGNINKKETAKNVVLISKNKKDVANTLLSNFIVEHDNKEKKRGRKNREYVTVEEYLSRQFNLNRSKAKTWNGHGDRDLSQVIVQFGKAEDRLDRDKQLAALKQFGADFCQFLGNTVVAAAIHMDEAAPHLQIDFLPVFKDKRGTPKVGISGFWADRLQVKDNRQAFERLRIIAKNEANHCLKENYSDLRIERSKELRLKELTEKIDRLEERGYEVERARKTISREESIQR